MLRRLGFFVAGVVSAFTVGAVVAEFWIHMIEHNAYTKAVR